MRPRRAVVRVVRVRTGVPLSAARRRVGELVGEGGGAIVEHPREPALGDGMGGAVDDRGQHHQRGLADLAALDQRRHPVAERGAQVAVERRHLGAGGGAPVQVPAHVDEAGEVGVLLDPAELVADHPAHGGAQRARPAAHDLPETLLVGGDGLDEQRVGDRLLGGEVVKQRAVGRVAGFADAGDRGLLVAAFDERGERRVEDAAAGVGLWHAARVALWSVTLHLDRCDIVLDINEPGTLIRTRREQLGLSQRTLALRAGTTQAAVSRIERGLTTPTWETVRALLLAMGYEPEVTARRLPGRWDPLHLAELRERPPGERLELALSANRLAGRLREAGYAARSRS